MSIMISADAFPFTVIKSFGIASNALPASIAPTIPQMITISKRIITTLLTLPIVLIRLMFLFSIIISLSLKNIFSQLMYTV